MQYSPKLKMAMEEIKEILAKNDIAGFVVLHTPGFSEYLHALETSYSCANVNHNGINFRLSQKELGREKSKQIAEGTFNMVSHFVDNLSRAILPYMHAHDYMKAKWGGEEFGGQHSSHISQNN